VVIDSRVVRNWKGLLIKSRLVMRDFATTKAAGGELYAATPSVSSLRLMLCLGSADLNECARKGTKYIAVVLDVSQAFPHAVLDEEVYTVVPQCLDGLSLDVGEAEPVVLRGGEILRVLRSLYGWRRSPRLWQQHFNKIVENKVGMARSVVEPATF